MAASYEISTFLQKFNQLSTSGFTANLNLSCCEGRITINLNADVRSLMSFDHPPPPPPRPPLFKHVKPSQLRRRKRRQDLTKTSCSSSNVDSTCEHTESTLIDEQNVSLNTESRNNKPELSIIKQPSVNVSLKEWSFLDIPSLEIKPPVNPHEVSSYQILSSTAEEAQSSSDTNICLFCNEEFGNWNEFLLHMNKSNYLCNNCLDYFSEKPWFSASNLVMVDSAVGQYLHLAKHAPRSF